KSFFNKKIFSSDFITDIREEVKASSSTRLTLELDYYFLGSYNYYNPYYTNSIKDKLNTTRVEDLETSLKEIEEISSTTS
ncbi:hypothetical protein LTR22_028109, partial [Elasticomyces elasticus]